VLSRVCVGSLGAESSVTEPVRLWLAANRADGDIVALVPNQPVLVGRFGQPHISLRSVFECTEVGADLVLAGAVDVKLDAHRQPHNSPATHTVQLPPIACNSYPLAVESMAISWTASSNMGHIWS